MKNLKLKKGFTLTELIIVIVIIGILAAVLIPSLSSYIKKAKKSAAEQDAMTIHSEFMATVPNEQYADINVLNFVVRTDNYLVIIQKGKLVASVSISEANTGDGSYKVSVPTSGSTESDIRLIESTIGSGEEAIKGLDTFAEKLTKDTEVKFIYLLADQKFEAVFTNAQAKDDGYGAAYSVSYATVTALK